VIYDSSALAAFFLNEEARPLVECALKNDSNACTVDFGLVEVANAIWKRWLAGKITTKQTMIIHAEIDLSLREEVLQVLSSAQLLKKAIQVSIRHKLSVYDSVFIAGCSRFRQRLVSLDERQKSLAGAENVKLFILAALEL